MIIPSKHGFIPFGRFCVFIMLWLFPLTFGWGHRCSAEFTTAKQRDPEYDKIYPYYVEVSAVSRMRPLNKPEGGGWGHLLMYIKGACIDQTQKYPQLKSCDDSAVFLHSPEAGVGVSVDKMFKTVNWVAIPGKRLFYDGNVQEGQRLGQSHFDATVQEAMRKNIFRGIEFHEEYIALKPADQSMESWVARQTLGTDYAIKFARTSLVARMPVRKSQIKKMIHYLNERNKDVFLGKTKFVWSAYYDNCAHTVHNTLAAAGIWRHKKRNQNRFKQFFNRAIPANEFADFAYLGMARPGALLKIIPAHTPNDLFGTDYKLYVLEGPIRKPKTQKIRAMLAEPRHTLLRENLLYFKQQYERQLRDDRGWGMRLLQDKHAELDGSAEQDKIKDSLADINFKLEIMTT